MGLPWKKLAKWAIEQAAKWAEKKLEDKPKKPPTVPRPATSVAESERRSLDR